MKNKQQLIENPEKGSKRQNREMAVVTYICDGNLFYSCRIYGLFYHSRFGSGVKQFGK